MKFVSSGLWRLSGDRMEWWTTWENTLQLWSLCPSFSHSPVLRQQGKLGTMCLVHARKSAEGVESAACAASAACANEGRCHAFVEEDFGRCVKDLKQAKIDLLMEKIRARRKWIVLDMEECRAQNARRNKPIECSEPRQSYLQDIEKFRKKLLEMQ